MIRLIFVTPILHINLELMPNPVYICLTTFIVKIENANGNFKILY